MPIAALTGLRYPTIKRAIELYERGNWDALRPADRGRSKAQGPGRPMANQSWFRLVSSIQCQALYKEPAMGPEGTSPGELIAKSIH